jgi:hypothetical protein
MTWRDTATFVAKRWSNPRRNAWDKAWEFGTRACFLDACAALCCDLCDTCQSDGVCAADSDEIEAKLSTSSLWPTSPSDAHTPQEAVLHCNPAST